MSMTDRCHDILWAFADVAWRGVVRGRVGHGHRRLAAPDPRRRRPHQQVRRRAGPPRRQRTLSKERGRRSSGRRCREGHRQDREGRERGGVRARKHCGRAGRVDWISEHLTLLGNIVPAAERE